MSVMSYCIPGLKCKMQKVSIFPIFTSKTPKNAELIEVTLLPLLKWIILKYPVVLSYGNLNLKKSNIARVFTKYVSCVDIHFKVIFTTILSLWPARIRP